MIVEVNQMVNFSHTNHYDKLDHYLTILGKIFQTYIA